MDVEDFLQDVQKPQIEALLYDYGADMLWCDIGMASVYPELGKLEEGPRMINTCALTKSLSAADWYNSAMKDGRQVAVNARCGANYSDFDVSNVSSVDHCVLTNSVQTPEYSKTTSLSAYPLATLLSPPQNFEGISVRTSQMGVKRGLRSIFLWIQPGHAAGKLPQRVLFSSLSCGYSIQERELPD